MKKLIRSVRQSLLWPFSKRVRYVAAMMTALEKISHGVVFKDSSRTDALRVVKDFEQVNDIPFDPFDPVHVSHVYGFGPHKALHRRFDKFFKERGNKSES